MSEPRSDYGPLLSGDDLERIDCAGGDEAEHAAAVRTAIYYREQALEGLLHKDILSEVLFALDHTRFCDIADRARKWLRTGIPPQERQATAHSGRNDPS